MDYEGAAKDLKDIRVTMARSAAQASRDPGWFYVIQGGVWLVGFLATQFLPSIAGPLWVVLNIAGIAAVVALSLFLYGKRARQRHPGLASRIVAISIGVVVFDLLLVLSFGLTGPRDFTLLLVLSLGFCYFVIGLITRQSMSAMGAFMALAVTAANLAFPAYFYLSVAVLGGGALIAYGAVLLRGKRTDA